MLDPINVKYWELAHPPDELGYHRNDDYSARCDICGDSKTNKNKKRLHLYKKSSYENDSIKCFNGECGYTSTMYKYLRDHHPHLVDAYVNEIGSNKLKSLSTPQTPKVLTINEVKKKNILEHFPKPVEFLQPNKEVLTYLLEKRGFTKELLKEKLNPLVSSLKVFFSPGMVQLGDKEVKLSKFIIIPLIENNEWYGFYSRSIENKTFYNYLPEKNSGYKLWNYFNINKKDTVYIFEAIFNALSTSLQAIACLGSDIPQDRLDEISKPVFVFDNDETGRKKTEKYIKLGYNVFIWPHNIKEKDTNELLVNKWTIDEIDNLIISNTFKGLVALTKLKTRQYF